MLLCIASNINRNLEHVKKCFAARGVGDQMAEVSHTVVLSVGAVASPCPGRLSAFCLGVLPIGTKVSI